MRALFSSKFFRQQFKNLVSKNLLKSAKELRFDKKWRELYFKVKGKYENNC